MIRGLISIWFFIGVLLLVYGVIILISSVTVTPAHTTVMADLHVGIWWGMLLIVIGGVYTFLFRPGRS